ATNLCEARLGDVCDPTDGDGAQPAQPWASGASRSRHAGPARATAISAPSRMPLSTTINSFALNRSATARTIAAPAGRIDARAGLTPVVAARSADGVA